MYRFVIKPNYMKLLLFIDRNGKEGTPINVRDCSKYIGMEYSHLNRVFQQFERENLIEKVVEKGKGQSFLIILTPRGQRIVEKLRELKKVIEEDSNGNTKHRDKDGSTDSKLQGTRGREDTDDRNPNDDKQATPKGSDKLPGKTQGTGTTDTATVESESTAGSKEEPKDTTGQDQANGTSSEESREDPKESAGETTKRGNSKEHESDPEGGSKEQAPKGSVPKTAKGSKKPVHKQGKKDPGQTIA